MLDSEIETAVRDVQLGNLGSRPLRNVVHMMIVVSDNTATNMVIERFTAEPSTRVASKPGALDVLRSDVALVHAPIGHVAMAITVDGMPRVDYSPDNAGNMLISNLSTILLEGLGGME